MKRLTHLQKILAVSLMAAIEGGSLQKENKKN